MRPSTPQLRVAIAGGGLAGASLTLALLQYPQLNVHVFESAPVFKEAGAAIGLAQYATQALSLMGMLERIYQAGAVPLDGAHFLLAQGLDAGKEIDHVEADGKALTSIVHRASLLRELLVDVPTERMHANKKLVTIDDSQDNVVLSFSDGTTHECDILIGADGIRSQVRKHILGKDDPAASPVPAGWWIIMSLQTYSDAQARIGKEFIDVENPREYMWTGDGAYILTNLLSGGELVQLALVVRCDSSEASGQWEKTATADEIKRAYQGWPPHLYRAVVELLCNEPTQQGFYFWDHLPARTYAKGAVCVMGDAAHSTTPWMGAGGGMSLEDSLILSTLLGRVQSLPDAYAALRVYDRVRRPRTQRVVEASRGTGLIQTGRDPEIGLDLAKLRAGLWPRWDFIRRFDNEKHRDEALQLLEAEILK